MPSKDTAGTTTLATTRDSTKTPDSSRKSKFLFKPFRSIGFMAGEVRVEIQKKGEKSFFLTIGVKTNFMILHGESLGLLFNVDVGGLEGSGNGTMDGGKTMYSDMDSDSDSGDIEAIASHQDYTFCAVGSKVKIFSRQALVHVFECDYKIYNLLVLGDFLFCSLENGVYIYNFKTKEYHNEISTGSHFTITAILHPSTYVNKILLASTQGSMQLWNFRSMSVVYEFKPYNSPITCMVQSPSIDVVAIGLLDGTIILHNIRVDKEIMRFRQEGKVFALSFRTDGHAVMASSNPTGMVALWNLQEKRLVHIMTSAHDGPIHTCSFLHGQSILLTASSDNSIKQWIFDSPDGIPRLLKSRSGHFKPPTRVRYYGGGDGENGAHSLLTSGQDQSLRFFSTIRDSQNVELSQGRLEHKANKLNVDVNSLRFPSIVDFSANSMKQKEWDNIITSHSGESTAKTWSFSKKKLGKHSLATKDGQALKAVWLSSCGNFAFLGSQGGRIDKYNMQSGLYRSSIPHAHTKAITSLFSDNTNTILVSASLDAHLKVWDFNKSILLHSIKLPASISRMEFHNESRLAALVCDDLVVRVVDVDSGRIVREFIGHSHRITDIGFSPDGRWLVSSSLDTTIRTWDLPTGFLVDCFGVERICTSLAFSPTGEFLATTHVDCLGVYLWSNVSMYGHVGLTRIDEKRVEEIISARARVLPDAGAAGIGDRGEIKDDAAGLEEDEEDIMMEQDQQDDITQQGWRNMQDDLIRLSSLPKSRWQNLLNLESIKERNRVKEAPKAPEKAPFLLSTKPGALPTFISAPTDVSSSSAAAGSRILADSVFGDAETRLVQLLQSGAAGQDDEAYTKVFEHLKHLGPSAVDFEIRNLPQDVEVIEAFLAALAELIESKRDFELGQSYLNVLIKVHGDLIRQASPVLVNQVRTLIEQAWERLEGKLLASTCLVDFSMN